MNDPQNPYEAPTVDVDAPTDRIVLSDFGIFLDDSVSFVPNGRSRPVGRGAAWQMFKAQPGLWLAALLLTGVAYTILFFIPLLNFFLPLLMPFIYAGIASAADQQRRTGTFELGALMNGVNTEPRSLLVVGGLTYLAYLVVAFMVGLTLVPQLMSLAAHNEFSFYVFTDPRFLVALLVGVVILIPVGFASYFSPLLIVFHKVPALTAMKMSLLGCVKNILPGLVYTICGSLLVFVSMIPLGLGLLVAGPVISITLYTAYRDIFIEDAA